MTVHTARRVPTISKRRLTPSRLFVVQLIVNLLGAILLTSGVLT